MHTITWKNVEEFNDACRDVLMMFTCIADEGGRLTDANLWVRFDPLQFIDATSDGEGSYGDLDLVKRGSAVAILCAFFDRWEEDQPLLDEVTDRFLSAIRDNRLIEYQDVADIVIEAIEREQTGSLRPWFNQAVQPIYHRYVRAYFIQLASIADWTH